MQKISLAMLANILKLLRKLGGQGELRQIEIKYADNICHWNCWICLAIHHTTILCFIVTGVNTPPPPPVDPALLDAPPPSP